MSSSTIITTVAVSVCPIVAAFVLNVVDDSHAVVPILLILASVGSIVAIIGNSFRRAREEQT